MNIHQGKTPENWDALSRFLAMTHQNYLTVRDLLLNEGREACDLVEAQRLAAKAEGILLAIAYMAKVENGGVPLTPARPRAGGTS